MKKFCIGAVGSLLAVTALSALFFACATQQPTRRVAEPVLIDGLYWHRAVEREFNPGPIPKTVPTFHSIGIYWRPEQGRLDNACAVEFRVAGTETWHWAQDLWFDVSTWPRMGMRYSYRGSIVNLTPNTRYEIRLTLDCGHSITVTETTWDENFPIKEVINVPGGSRTFRTTRGGNAVDGYVVFDGGGAVIDVNASGLIIRGSGGIPDSNAATRRTLNPNRGYLHNIIIDHDFVIIRNFVLKGAMLEAVIVSPGVNHVVIEDLDISNWGDMRVDRIFGNSRGAIAVTLDNSQVVIQRNRIHSPRHSSNTWMQNRTRPDGAGEHPYGPIGVEIEGDVVRCPATRMLVPNGIWNIVVRYNEIYANRPNTFFEDGIQGAPPDTDIYRNIIRDVVDNALEPENGGGRNVRLWENFMYNIYNAIATVPVHVGPMYIWRNISDGFYNFGHAGRSRPFKVGGDAYSGSWFERQAARGMHFFYHNVNLQADADDGFQQTDGPPLFMIAKNNIVLARYRSVRGCNNPLIIFSHNLFNAPSDAQNPYGITGYPVWAQGSGPSGNTPSGWYQLDSSSPGFGTAVRLANFNDMFDSPDMGAHQSGTGQITFGRNAVFVPPPLPIVQGPRPDRLPPLYQPPPPPPPERGHYDIVPFTSSLIANLQVTDRAINNHDQLPGRPLPNNQVWAIRPNIDAGRFAYGDRNFPLRYVPAELVGSDWIRTPNTRTNQTPNATLATFTALRNIYVYIAYDSRSDLSPGPMGWLASWELTDLILLNGESVSVTPPEPGQGVYFIRRRAFNAGDRVVLGGNHQTGRSMYIPIIRER